jgi:DNA gyrase/topoisomerase IV subunit A
VSEDAPGQRITDRLEALTAIRASQRDPHRLVDVLLTVDDPATAVDTLVAELGVSRLGATALLDMQFRRLIGRDRVLIESEIEDLQRA